MARPELIVRAGAKLRAIRVRLGLSVRDVERLSMDLARDRHNPYLSFSRTWITDVENGRFVPGSFKMASLSEIYGMDLAEIHKLYGLSRDITQERPVFRPPKTHLLIPTKEPTEGEASAEDSSAEMRIEETSLLTGIVDVWGSVPVPLLRRFALRQCLYGYIGTEDESMAPLLPPGSFVQIDAKQNRIRKGPFKKSSSESHFARPIYFLDIRTGYACGWCELKDGVLTLVPHPDSGVETRTFRYPSEVSVVGRVTAVTMSIEEERFVPLDQSGKGPTNPKK
ncbi:MAG TPA: helix-turn-helix transcriptional regulator [Candidatus Acidoferrum sp.]|nr:helix-turn-helix transcriptional regulator [Candidatus Acidoferrum sp.]